MNQTTRIAAQGLEALSAQVTRDLETLNLPPRGWVPVLSRQGKPVLDAVVVGAGMNGIAAAGSLILKGVRNIQVLETRTPGQEGVWRTTARMDTLRSPKTLPGPCFGIPSLTYRAWHAARFGEADWQALYKIPNQLWQDYLGWLQRVLSLPIRHECRLERITPEDGLLRLELAGGDTLLARRVVLATGRAGAGGLALPAMVPTALWPDLAAHAGEAVDFEQLRGKRLAVIGGGASAWDNAATALERGAARADMYVRRAALPQINKGRGSAGPAFHIGWSALDDAERWALIAYMHDHQAPPPHETVNRALRQPGFHIHLGTPTQAVRREGAEVVLTLANGGEARADFLVVGTGFSVDLARQPELAAFAPHIARWQDRFTPPPGLERPEMAAFPYLGPGFELQPRTDAAPPELGRIHLMNYGAHASHGGIASDIPGVAVAGERLGNAVVAHLFRECIAPLREELAAFDEPELQGTPFFVPRG